MIICKYQELNRYEAAIPGLAEAMELIEKLQSFEAATYPLSNGNRVMTSQGTSRPVETALGEIHRKYLDIHYVVAGSEIFGWAPLEDMTPAGEFDEEKDAGMYNGEVQFITVPAGFCYVVFPEEIHMPAVHFQEPIPQTKVVVKLKV